MNQKTNLQVKQNVLTKSSKKCRVGLTGTVCVGKTSLIETLAILPEFKDYKIATERSKYLRDLGIPLNTDSTLKGQMIFGAERASELINDNLLTDRTVIDVIAFTMESKSIPFNQKLLFRDLYKELISEYDYIFYISPEGIPIEDNGVRTVDPIYRNKIDQSILSIIKPFKYYTLSGSTEERISQIREVVFS